MYNCHFVTSLVYPWNHACSEALPTRNLEFLVDFSHWMKTPPSKNLLFVLRCLNFVLLFLPYLPDYFLCPIVFAASHLSYSRRLRLSLAPGGRGTAAGHPGSLPTGAGLGSGGDPVPVRARFEMNKCNEIVNKLVVKYGEMISKWFQVFQPQNCIN